MCMSFVQVTSSVIICGIHLLWLILAMQVIVTMCPLVRVVRGKKNYFLVGYGMVVPQFLSVMNNVKTKVEVAMVGEGVPYVRGLIRGICAAISSVVTFLIHYDASYDRCFWRKSCSDSDAGYKYKC